MRNLKKIILNHYFWLGFLILVAGFLRFYQIDRLTHFQYDQARDALYTKRLVADHKLRLIGPQASPGFYTGPAYYYLMAPFLLIFNLNPAGMDFGVAMIGLMTVCLLYFLLKKITCSAAVAFTLSIMYAVQPQILWQSRFSWNPNLTPFFVLLFLWGLILVLDKKTWGWLLSSVSLGFLIQLHFSTVSLIPVVFLFIFLQRHNPKIFNRHFWLSLIIFGLMMSPFLAIELRHNFPNIRNIHKFITQGPDTKLPPPPLFQGIWEKMSFLFSQLPFGFKNTFVSVLAVTGFFLASFYLVRKNKQKDINFLILSPVLFLILMSAIYRGSFFQYYLTFLYSLTFLILGLILSVFFKNKIVLLLFLPVIYLNLKNDINLFNRTSTVDNLKSVAAVIAADDGTERRFNFVGIRGGDRYDHNGVDYRYYLETFYNKRALDWDIVDYQNSEVLYVVSNQGKIDPLASTIWEIVLFGPKVLANEWILEDSTVIYKLMK